MDSIFFMMEEPHAGNYDTVYEVSRMLIVLRDSFQITSPLLAGQESTREGLSQRTLSNSNITPSSNDKGLNPKSFCASA